MEGYIGGVVTTHYASAILLYMKYAKTKTSLFVDSS
jgi:predicted CDP-diglyceride synthetase/phosphatidate cytidylyltransferase